MAEAGAEARALVRAGRGGGQCGGSDMTYHT